MVAIATPVAPAPSARPRRTAQATTPSPALVTLTEAQQTSAPTLAEIAAAQDTGIVPAVDRSYPVRQLAGLQKLYAHRVNQLTALEHIFQEGAPEITLRGETQQLTLRGEFASGIYQELSYKLDEALRELEVQIVLAHQQVAQWAEDVVTDFTDKGKTDYVPHILALCQPTAAPASTTPASPSLIP